MICLAVLATVAMSATVKKQYAFNIATLVAAVTLTITVMERMQ